KIARSSNRLGTDVVVCHQYRYYHYFYSVSNQSYDEGILLPQTLGSEIINYPKPHSKNCTAKHQNTGNRFKPVVRIVKNMRGRLFDDGVIGRDLAPSYFIEGMLYNVPDDQFKGDLSSTFCNCVNWLLKADRSKFVCPSTKHWLFGNSSVEWDDNKCAQFLNALVDLWNRW
ncbi:MAG: nucleotidyltransferase, partial [Bacteroidota bacterium]